MRKNHQWTNEERTIIRRDYKHTRESCRQLAEYLSRLGGERITAFGVRGQISNMGIAKSDDRHPWSPKQDEQLAELIPQYCPRAVARKMHRSLNSVVVRAKRIGIHRRFHTGWFTKREVMEILGHDHRWVQKRIDSGALKASYHYDTKPSQLGSASWHIDEQDLAAFIRRYPEELVGCNIDIMMIVELLAGITNH